MKRVIINNSIEEKFIVVRETWIVYNKNGDEKTIYIKQQRSLPNFYKPISNLSKFIFSNYGKFKGISIINFDTLPNITTNSIIYTDINKIDFDICDLLVTAKEYSRTLAFILSTSSRLMSFSEEPSSFVDDSLKQTEEIDWIIDKLKLKKS